MPTITLWAHLEDDGIDSVFLELVQLIGQGLLHFLRTYTLELSVHALNPCTAKFAFLLRVDRQKK
jgi:hypothetical protein